MVSAEQDLTGVLLEGRYEIRELLAVGGMSRIYRGVDRRLDREVALKVMDPNLAADPAFRDRFEREARAIARIDHPCVIEVYDQGEHLVESRPPPVVYLAMELVTGGTLRDVLTERGALDPPEALAVLEPVLSALAAAHAQGLTHRDVKPENVLISNTGAVKVADFGLVTAAAQHRQTKTGMILGTMAYLSPEQVVGGDVDARSDVYAAGVLLYELLTGETPYTGDHALSVAYQHVNKDVPAPSELVPDISPDLDALVASATRRNRDARPSDAQTLLYAVRGVRASARIPRVPVPVPGSLDPQATVPVATPLDADGMAAATVPEARSSGRPPHRATRALTSMVPPGVDAAEDPPTALIDAPTHLHRRRQGRRRTAIWVAAVVLLAVMVGLFAWQAGTSRWTTTPVLEGMPRDRAEQTVREAELVPSVREVSSDTVPAERVVSSEPPSGTEARKGSTVSLLISTGRPKVPPIPVGTAVPEAEELIKAAGLAPRELPSARRPHPTATAGTVIGTLPKAGTELASASPVTLVISMGPPSRLRRDVEDAIGDQLNGLLDDIFGGRGHR